MKLSYTIRGWKDRDWSQLCAAAVDTRLQGLEIDSVKNPIMQKKMSPINPELAVAAHRRLAEQGGLMVDDRKVEGPAERIDRSAFEKGYIHVKKGKKVHLKITIEE